MTAHQFTVIHKSRQELSGIERTSSDHHRDISEAQKTKDTADLQKIYQWLVDHNPFSKANKNLKLLSTGVVGTKEVICDSTEEVRQKTHKKLYNMLV